MTPALATNTSSLPWRSTVAVTAARTASRSVTSRAHASMPSVPAASSSSRSVRRAAAITWWPSAARRVVIAWPMPLLAPVTKAIFWWSVVMSPPCRRRGAPGRPCATWVWRTQVERAFVTYRGDMPEPRDETDLGAFLRARRAQVTPDDVGLGPHSRRRRRVPGLRREEVALLAGVSPDYYTRLEQGRERHPSPEVLAAIARALQLTDDARDHLFRLAGA